MKIVFYIDSMYRGGAQRVMNELVTYFSEVEGEDVTLINNFIQRDVENCYVVSNKAKREYLEKTTEKKKHIRNAKRVLSLRKIIKSQNPDIVISFLGPTNIRMLVATIGLKVKKIVSVRNDPRYEYGEKSSKKLIANLIFRLADSVVFQTSDAMNYFNDSIKRKGIVILNPVNDSFYDRKLVKNRSNIICVGRLVEQKNHKLLIDAYSLLPKELQNDRLVICGDGELYYELIEYCRRKRVLDKVDFVGNVSNVKEYLEESKLFVLSSDFEGLPNALMEAMAVGIPVISTNCPCGGPKELTCEGKYGKLTPCNDVLSLRDSIALSLSMPSEEIEKECREISKRAEDFKVNTIMKSWKKCINTILEDK